MKPMEIEHGRDRSDDNHIDGARQVKRDPGRARETVGSAEGRTARYDAGKTSLVYAR